MGEYPGPDDERSETTLTSWRKAVYSGNVEKMVMNVVADGPSTVRLAVPAVVNRVGIVLYRGKVPRRDSNPFLSGSCFVIVGRSYFGWLDINLLIPPVKVTNRLAGAISILDTHSHQQDSSSKQKLSGITT